LPLISCYKKFWDSSDEDPGEVRPDILLYVSGNLGKSMSGRG